jgi:endonuclease YncB( thermonuclease family)
LAASGLPASGTNDILVAMNKTIVMFALLATVLLAVLAARQGDRRDSLVGAVTYVRDGHTIEVEEVPVRLNGVAAPTLDEPGGHQAKDFMEKLVFGNTVTCDLSSQRSYDRRIGTCYLDGKDIAATVIGAGLARDCARHSGGRYAEFHTAASEQLPLPGYCAPR